MLRPKAFNQLSKMALLYLSCKTDLDIMKFYRKAGQKEKRNPFNTEAGEAEAQAYLRQAPLSVIPLYVNHPSPVVKEIIKNRLA